MTNRSMTRTSAFEACALPQLEDLYRVARYFFENESDAQNLIEELFISAYNSHHECQSVQECRLWLFEIMTRDLVGSFRPSTDISAANVGEKIDKASSPDSQWGYREAGHDFDEADINAISAGNVRKAISALPHALRLIALLSYQAKFSIGQIANFTDADPGIVKSKLHLGRKLIIRDILNDIRPKAGAG